jgi:hypothetical protein
MVLLAVVVVHAQTAQQPDPNQAITVTGCVQNEKDVLKANAMPKAMGMGNEFVLTHSTVQAGSPAAKPPEQPAAAPSEAAGTSGSLGKIYRVTGDQESSLQQHLGQKVEITGRFKDEAAARRELGAIGTSGTPPPTAAEPTADNTPEITIDSVKKISDTCGGYPDSRS